MPRFRKTPEVEILKTKWHNSEVHNDAAVLHARGIVAPDLADDYARVKIDARTTISFKTKDRMDKYLRANPDQTFEITITSKQ